MEYICKECGGRNSYNESEFEPGATVELACRRCGGFNEVTIPGERKREEREVKKAQPKEAELTVKQRPEPENIEPEVSPAPDSFSDDIVKAKMLLEAERIKLEHRKLDMEQRRAESLSHTTTSTAPAASKSKMTAGLLGIFLGGFGAHKFYLGKTGMGILYLVFCWTYIPGILGLIEGIMYLSKSDAQWAAEHS